MDKAKVIDVVRKIVAIRAAIIKHNDAYERMQKEGEKLQQEHQDLRKAFAELTMGVAVEVDGMMYHVPLQGMNSEFLRAAPLEILTR